MLHGAGIFTITFTRTKSPSFVGFYIPAPWVAYGIYRSNLGSSFLQTWVELGGRRSMNGLKKEPSHQPIIQEVPTFQSWLIHVYNFKSIQKNRKQDRS
jgi:hypothetical protein